MACEFLEKKFYTLHKFISANITDYSIRDFLSEYKTGVGLNSLQIVCIDVKYNICKMNDHPLKFKIE